MTNTNYFVKTSGGRYILRLPGRMTESMINRENEKRNAQIASDMGFNCTLLYCNAETGVQALPVYRRGGDADPADRPAGGKYRPGGGYPPPAAPFGDCMGKPDGRL